MPGILSLQIVLIAGVARGVATAGALECEHVGTYTVVKAVSIRRDMLVSDTNVRI